VEKKTRSRRIRRPSNLVVCSWCRSASVDFLNAKAGDKANGVIKEISHPVNKSRFLFTGRMSQRQRAHPMRGGIARSRDCPNPNCRLVDSAECSRNKLTRQVNPRRNIYPFRSRQDEKAQTTRLWLDNQRSTRVRGIMSPSPLPPCIRELIPKAREEREQSARLYVISSCGSADLVEAGQKRQIIEPLHGNA